MTETNWKQRLLDLAIEKKLRYSSIVITAMIMLFLTSVFLWSEYTRYKSEIEADLDSNSKLIAENLLSALLFEDASTANEILNTLKVKSSIVYAAVFNKKNQLFAVYGVKKKYPSLLKCGKRVCWDSDYIVIKTPILQGEEPLGTVLLVYTQKRFKEYMHFIIFVTIATMLFSIFIANILFRRIYFYMIKPLLHLTDAMQRVTLKKDFDVKIENNSVDEIGILSQGFNKMIAKIKAELDHRTKIEAKLKNLAMFDQLTKLPNRHYFQEELANALKRHQRKEEYFALLFLDLDGFKNVNDTLGHDYGDLLLQKVALRLQNCVRESDFVARLGGDEFTIILENIDNPEQIKPIVQKIVHTISQEVDLEDTKAYVSVSIGISRYKVDSKSASLLMQYADLAMYYAKESGKNGYVFYSSDLKMEKSRAYLIETALRSAIANGELSLYYHPKINLKSDVVEGMEALLRWHSKTLGEVAPSEFIPIAEKSSLIIDLEKWVIQTASKQVKAWNACSERSFKVAVNISQMHFKQKYFVKDLEAMMQKSGISLEHLEIELAESVFLVPTQENIQKLSYLQSLGVQVSIDDFGTGYSSLRYLKKLPIHTIKIDKSFVDGLLNDEDDVAITKTIIDLAKRFHLQVVAEGVSSQEQVELLKLLGCDMVQGYYFFEPLSVERFEQYFVVDKVLN